MKSLLESYVRGIQSLRIRAGLTILDWRMFLRSTAKDFLISSAVLGSLLTSVGILSGVDTNQILLLTAFSIVTAALFPYMKYRLLARARGKMLENELTYFIISEAITATDSTELISDVCELTGWEGVFPTLSREGLRLKVYRKFLTLLEAVNLYVKYLPSEFVSRLLSDYVLTVSRGIVGSWLSHTSTELLRKLGGDTKAFTKLRTTTVLVIGILVSYLPTLMFSLSVISGSRHLTSAITLTPLLVIASAAVLPRNTQHLRTYLKFGRKANLLTYASYGAALYTAYQIFSGSTKVEYLVITTSVLFLINGVIGIRRFYGVIYEIYEIPKIIHMFAETPHILINPVSALKDVLSRCKSKSWKGLGANLDLNSVSSGVNMLNSWLGRYTYYVLTKSMVNGSLSKELLLSLRVITLDMLEDLKQYFVSTVPLIAMSLMVPWLMNSMISLAGVEALGYGFHVYLLTISYSLYVDYVIFNTPKITAVSAATLLLLGTIWVG